MQSFKGRQVNQEKPVRAYFNLHTKLWSIMQDGLVVGHAKSLFLTGIKFKVSESGRQRVIKEGRKNVHAFIEGFYAGESYELEGARSLYYNPYKVSTFVDAETRKEPGKVSAVLLTSNKQAMYVA
jgi:hypothetical protein